MTCGAVIPAAGTGQRLGGRDKALLPLRGRPVLAWVLDALARAEVAEQVVVVANATNLAAIHALLEALALPLPIEVCLGGAERALSVRRGVERLGPDVTLVLVHDAARPLVTPELFRRVVEAAERYGAVIAAVPVTDTIKQVSADGRVLGTLERASLIAAQTPQAFRRDWLLEAYRRAEERLVSATDEAMLLEHAGFPVYTVPGAVENLKITTSLDLELAELLLSRRAQG